jgi:hypothetical protein
MTKSGHCRDKRDPQRVEMGQTVLYTLLAGLWLTHLLVHLFSSLLFSKYLRNNFFNKFLWWGGGEQGLYHWATSPPQEILL